MNKRHIAIMAVIAAIVSSCQQYNIEETLLMREDISLTVRNEVIMIYDPATWQLGQNVTTNEYRVHDDNMGNYFILTCDSKPWYAGQTIKADLKWTAPTRNMDETGLEFSVEKTDDNGLVWLWNSSRKIGIVIRNLQ